MRDLRKITLLAFAVLLGFGALWMKSFFDQQSLGVDGVAGYSTGQSTAEEYRIERETSEAYGQFELTIDPLRQSYALDVQSDQPYLARDFVNVVMEKTINDVEITLSCHRCYPVTDVSGGTVKFQKVLWSGRWVFTMWGPKGYCIPRRCLLIGCSIFPWQLLIVIPFPIIC